MQSMGKSKGEKLHTRNIEVSIYDYDGQRIIAEGVFKDDRLQETHLITGETFPKGAIHHMAIRLLVNSSNFLIEDIDVELLSVPRPVCRETIDCLSPLKGLTVTKGFTSKVKRLVGGTKGCTHLMELILAMAPVIFQGFAALQSQRPGAFDSELVKMMSQSLVNTCHAWRADGPVVEKLKKKLNKK
jgi:hypothetical protein